MDKIDKLINYISCRRCIGVLCKTVTKEIIQELTKIKNGSYVTEDYMHLMLKKQKEAKEDKIIDILEDSLSSGKMVFKKLAKDILKELKKQ